MKNESTKRLSQGNSTLMNLIRILAAWMVLVGHALGFYNISPLKDQEYFPYLQNIGVAILFFLSGFFTIYSLENKIKDNRQYSGKDFFADRFTRIGIAYIPALVFTFIIDTVRIHLYPNDYPFYEAYNLKTWIGNLFMFQDFSGILGGGYNSFVPSYGSNRPFWTLAVEWWIYMAFGYFVFVILRSIRKKEMNIARIVVLTVLMWVPVHHLTGGRGNGLTFVWLLGVGVYYIYDKIKVQKWAIGIIFTVTFFLSIYYGCLEKEAYTIPCFLFVAFLMLLLLCFGKEIHHICFEKTIHFLASYTYSLYLCHYPILDFLSISEIRMGRYEKFILAIVLSNLVAIISSVIFENNKKLSGILRGKVFQLLCWLEKRANLLFHP